MATNVKQAREAIRRCRELREAGKVEAVLRGEFASRLRLIFPSVSDESWINQYSTGTEAHTKIGKDADKIADRFIDNLVGSTTIEYEADLRVTAKRDEGYSQVREHAAGLVRSGVPTSQVRGVLSDTVEWYAYDVSLGAGIEPAACTPKDITLCLVQELKLGADDEQSAERLIAFVRRHLAREKSRPLGADFLTLDLGLDSPPYRRAGMPLLKLVVDGRADDPSIMLATDLWSQFVDYLERDDGGFRADAYVDEAYLCVLARLLSANVLAGQAILSDDDEIIGILDGSYFRAHYQLSNMVELDYFGWLTTPKNVARLVPIARDMQRDLYAYDFSYRPEEDLFGKLMAELARRSQRKLLGQEWTPAWLSALLAKRCLDNIPAGEKPQIIDMCCGSGSILAEILKIAKGKLGYHDIQDLHNVATGFDIDPLAVTLSKTTWVITLADEIKASGSPVVIPIYHADSLFAVTPVSASLPNPGEVGEIEISMDGTTVKLPYDLFQPSYSDLFDRIVDWAYDEALEAQKKGEHSSISEKDTETFITGAAAACKTTISSALMEALIPAVHALVTGMSGLALANRNGIWAFILRNTYRPGLLSGQFNGLVSNPPWLAMSGLAANPYREVLTARAKIYGICPTGQSFLHLELGTTHLLHAVDRYLADEASVACLVPGTILNGHHHEPFRRHKFLSSDRPVAFQVDEIWQIEPGTFKYPSVGIIGRKRKSVEDVSYSSLSAFFAKQAVGTVAADVSIRALGAERIAWVLEKDDMPLGSGGMKEVPQQGADLMPRTAVCVEILNSDGPEYRVNTPQAGSLWGFTVKAAKEMKDERFAGHAAPSFIFRIAQSENLLPFALGEHCASIAIPAQKEDEGVWNVCDVAEIRRMGFTDTARRFQAINDKLEAVGKGKTIQHRIDERGKLTKQVFGTDGYIVLAGAGGKHICSACIPVSDAEDLVIDQTLYWVVIDNEDEAWFLVGMLNSHAMSEAIAPFNPKGAFGERHIHALPYRLMPVFDPSNQDHCDIADFARKAAALAQEQILEDDYLNNPNRALASRRRRLRKELSEADDVRDLERLCAAILGTSVKSND